MGVYLSSKSYLRPRQKTKTKQRIIAITTASITLSAAAIIFTSLEFGNNPDVVASSDIDNQQSEITIPQALSNSNIVMAENIRSTNINFPVELAYFKVIQNPSTIKLKWSSVSEYNNEYFTLEKSVNRSGFVEIACLDSKEKSTASLDYSFIDESPGEGLIFYRLKQHSYDGKCSYLALEKVSRKSETEEYSLYIEGIGPEPFDKYFNINYYSERKGGVSVELFNKYGKNVFKYYTTANQGYNTCRFIEGDKLTDNEYTLRIANSSGAYVKKIRKRV